MKRLDSNEIVHRAFSVRKITIMLFTRYFRYFFSAKPLLWALVFSPFLFLFKCISTHVRMQATVSNFKVNKSSSMSLMPFLFHFLFFSSFLMFMFILCHLHCILHCVALLLRCFPTQSHRFGIRYAFHAAVYEVHCPCAHTSIHIYTIKFKQTNRIVQHSNQ